MSETQLRLLLTAARNLLKLGGVTGVFISDDLALQILSMTAALAGLLWSAWRDVHAAQR